MSRTFVTLPPTPFQWARVTDTAPLSLYYTFYYMVVEPDGTPSHPAPSPDGGLSPVGDIVPFSYSETVATLHTKVAARVIEIVGPTTVVFLDDKGFL